MRKDNSKASRKAGRAAESGWGLPVRLSSQTTAPTSGFHSNLENCPGKFRRAHLWLTFPVEERQRIHLTEPLLAQR